MILLLVVAGLAGLAVGLIVGYIVLWWVLRKGFRW